MKIIITGRRISVDEDLKALVEKKLSRLDKYFKDDAVAYVTLGYEKNDRKRLELTVSSSGVMFRSEESDKTFNNALDTSMDVIERQIRKNKTKLEKRLRDGALKQIPVSEEKEIQYATAKTKKFKIDRMSTEDAVLQMELLGHEFFMFRNEENDEISVVYKRKDGSYGLIIPE